MSSMRRNGKTDWFIVIALILAVLFVIWVNLPGFGCDGTAVRGVLRVECLD